MRPASALAALAAGALACGPVEAPLPPDPAPLGWCVGRAFAPAPAEGFTYLANELLASVGTPGHSWATRAAEVAAQDPIEQPFAP
jgi:hypothetical protein